MVPQGELMTGVYKVAKYKCVYLLIIILLKIYTFLIVKCVILVMKQINLQTLLPFKHKSSIV